MRELLLLIRSRHRLLRVVRLLRRARARLVRRYTISLVNGEVARSDRLAEFSLMTFLVCRIVSLISIVVMRLVG